MQAFLRTCDLATRHRFEQNRNKRRSRKFFLILVPSYGFFERLHRLNTPTIVFELAVVFTTSIDLFPKEILMRILYMRFSHLSRRFSINL